MNRGIFFEFGFFCRFVVIVNRTDHSSYQLAALFDVLGDEMFNNKWWLVEHA
jgi:hypothetical protein